MDKKELTKIYRDYNLTEDMLKMYEANNRQLIIIK